MFMKLSQNGACWLLAIATAVSAAARPLNESKIASDAKWVLHLDMDAFRASTLGSHVIKKIIQPKIDEGGSIKKLNLSINLNNISSITAYGPAFEKNGQGVLMIETSADVKKDLDTIAGMAALSGAGKGVELVESDPYPLYSFNGGIFIAPKVGNVALVAKSKEQIARARDVLLGKSESMSKAGMLKLYPGHHKNVFFYAAANGFSGELPTSPQAQMLREANGGRIMLSEDGDKLALSLVLRSKDEAGATKIQQVLQGIVALMTLSQEQRDQDMVDLARAAKIGAEGKNVTVELRFPVAQAITKIEEESEKRAARHGKAKAEEEKADEESSGETPAKEKS
jgi:hypothetical protein